MDQARATLRTAYQKAEATLGGNLEELAWTESQWTVHSLNVAAGGKIAAVTLAPDALTAIVENLRLDGAPTASWWAKQGADTARGFKGQVRLGLLQGETVDQIVRRVRRTKGKGYRDGEGHSVLFANAIDIINTLTAAKAATTLKTEIKRYLQPRLLVIDELGYLPIDKLGADLLFQVISQRYESGSIALTTNRLFRKWSEIFNNDSMITSAVLDRLLHHAEVVTITGKSYRAKDRVEEAA